MVMDINNCKASLKTPEALKYCQGYCAHFNPIVYNKYFEGEIDKLFSYEKALRNLAIKNEEKLEKENSIH